MAESEVQSLITEVNRAADAYAATSSRPCEPRVSTATPRHALLKAAKKLVNAIEDPEEEVWRFVLQPTAHACAIAAWNCNLLAPWPKERMTAKELAEHVKADQVLVGEFGSRL